MINVKLTTPECKPHVGSENAAGMDLKVLLSQKQRDANAFTVIAPGETRMLDTGVAVEIPEGWVGIIAPRSSLGKKTLMLTNTIGVIDSDYRGTIKVSLYNYGTKEAIIDNFERVVQLMIIPHYSTAFKVVPELSTTKRGDNGFGSTGSK